MDSGTSGSHQSSSDVNDESYDSRAAADSFFIPNPLKNYNNIHLPNYHNSNPNTTLSNATTTGNNMMPHPSLQPPTAATAAPAARNPKKRSRASRRAPTTVLTTDTTNFRAMVQEFTGIPSTPFGSNNNSISTMISPSLISARTRQLDLFRSTALDPSRATSAYPRRPLQIQPTISTDINNLIRNNNMVNSASNSNNNSSFACNNNNYQLPIASAQASDLNYNPLLNSLLQTTSTKFFVPTSTDYVHGASRDRAVKMDGFDHGLIVLGHQAAENITSLDHQTLNSCLPSLVSTDQVAALRNNIGNENTDRDFSRTDHNDIDDRDLTRPMKMVKHINGDSSSNLCVGEKGLENVVPTMRSEGMIESWICSSE